VVDGKPAQRHILETRLSMIGYDVMAAAEVAKEALDAFRKGQSGLDTS